MISVKMVIITATNPKKPLLISNRPLQSYSIEENERTIYIKEIPLSVSDFKISGAPTVVKNLSTSFSMVTSHHLYKRIESSSTWYGFAFDSGESFKILQFRSLNKIPYNKLALRIG